jgi:MYXO-CTERM domain-containing protein
MIRTTFPAAALAAGLLIAGPGLASAQTVGTGGGNGVAPTNPAAKVTEGTNHLDTVVAQNSTQNTTGDTSGTTAATPIPPPSGNATIGTGTTTGAAGSTAANTTGNTTAATPIPPPSGNATVGTGTGTATDTAAPVRTNNGGGGGDWGWIGLIGLFGLLGLRRRRETVAVPPRNATTAMRPDNTL